MNFSWQWTGLLRRLVEIRSSEALLTQYVAVIAGLRHALDDWIPASHFQDFCELMAQQELSVEADCVFKPLVNVSTLEGRSLAPTTQAAGLPFPQGMDDSQQTRVHVIVSSRSAWAAQTLAAGWYPVFVDRRMVRKPLVDHRRLGIAFGYPECCVNFFISHNDWPRFNTLADAAQASTCFRWETNCLLKHSPWSTLFHMPCSFDCRATVDYSKKLLDALSQYDAAYATRIQASLQQCFLVISERLAYVLIDASVTEKARASYHKAIFVGAAAEHDRYGELLAGGDELEISDGVVFIYNDGRLIHTFETRCDRGIAEVPLLLAFK
jgi:hypothetical protein